MVRRVFLSLVEFYPAFLLVVVRCIISCSSEAALIPDISRQSTAYILIVSHRSYLRQSYSITQRDAGTYNINETSWIH